MNLQKEIARAAKEEKVAGFKKATAIKEIAEKSLGLETLETRKSDGLDFSDQAVWNLKAALEAAYEAGRNAKR